MIHFIYGIVILFFVFRCWALQAMASRDEKIILKLLKVLHWHHKWHLEQTEPQDAHDGVTWPSLSECYQESELCEQTIDAFSKELGVKNDTAENHDCTDFPKRPCRQCGATDRPQYDGTCNDGHCDNYERRGT